MTRRTLFKRTLLALAACYGVAWRRPEVVEAARDARPDILREMLRVELDRAMQEPALLRVLRKRRGE